MTNTLSTPSSVIPGMWYRDAPAAIDWLCRVFGFEKHVVVPGPDGTILHAELTLGGGMLMLGSIHEGGQRRFIAQPDEIGGVETHGLNLIVADADAVHVRAKASTVPARRPAPRSCRTSRTSRTAARAELHPPLPGRRRDDDEDGRERERRDGHQAAR
jgi:uncharacterized glyoxalase superfamily protein PhnB